MRQVRFDSISRLFAERRTRRAALMAAGIGAAGMGLSQVGAQDATPAGSPVAGAVSDATGTSFMFVQTFGAGSLDAATEGVPNVLLVADHLAGQTLYFSDRPERIVGMVPTEQFLAAGADARGLGFTPTDPPNAALVLPDDRVLIVELLDPEYDAATGQVRYQLHVLDDVSQVDLKLDTEPLTAAEAAGDFAAASLFIDDCPDGQVVCVSSSGATFDYTGAYIGYCYNWADVCCAPCNSNDLIKWGQLCTDNYPDQCGGPCTATSSESMQCS